MANALDEFKKKYKQYQTDPTSTDSLASNLDDFRAKYAEYAPSAVTSANESRIDVQDRLNTINKINSDATQFAINNYNNKVNNMLEARQNLYDSRLGANNYNILQDAIDWKNNVMSFANQQNGIAQKGLNNLLQTARDTNTNRIGNISQQDAMRLQDIDRNLDILRAQSTEGRYAKNEVANANRDEWKQITGYDYADPNELKRRANIQLYNRVPEYDDFEEKSKYIEGTGDHEYEVANGKASSNSFKKKRYDVASTLTGDKENYITEQERKIYNYIYATEGKERAKEYYDSLNLSKRKAGAESTVDSWGYVPGVSDAMSVLYAPQKAEGLIGAAFDIVSGQEIDPYADYFRSTRAQKNVRNTTSEKILGEDPNFGNKAANFAYQTGMSMADFLFTTAISGGFGGAANGALAGGIDGVGGALSEAMSLATMGAGAAADSMQEARENGIDSKRAVVLGTIAGIAEIFTEKVSLETLLDPELVADGSLKYIIKNMLAEGSEEASSDLINWTSELFYDLWVDADKSTFLDSVNKYQQSGLSQGEAVFKTFMDMGQQLLMDAAGGALSGGIMAGGGSVVNNYQQNRGTGSYIRDGEENYDVTTSVIEEGLSGEFGEKAKKNAVKMANQFNSGRNLTDYQLGKQYNLNQSGDNTKLNLQKEAIGNALDTSRVGEQTKNVALKLYDGKIDASNYFAQVLDIQKAAEQNVPMNEITQREGVDLKASAVKDIYMAAKNDQMEVVDSGRENDLREESGNWNDGENQGITSRELLEGTEQNVAVEGNDSGKISEENRRGIQGQKVTEAFTGIGLDNNNTARVVDSSYSNEVKEAVDYLNRYGVNQHVFAGSNLSFSTSEGTVVSRGVFDGKDIYFRADHPAYKPLQIGKHEVFHKLLDSGAVSRSDAIERVKQAIGDRAYNDIKNMYAEAYRGSNEDYEEEMLCDLHGNMNVFENRFVKGSLSSKVNEFKVSLASEELTQMAEASSEKIANTINNSEVSNLVEAVDGSVVKKSLETWENTDITKLRKKLKEAGFENAEIDKWISNVNGVASIIAADKMRLDYKAADNQVMLKNNEEYVRTLDASTLCAKRLLYQGVYNDIQRQLPNTPLFPWDVVRIRQIMDNMGLEAPCGICYVESRRKNLGKFADVFLHGDEKHTAYKGPYIPTIADLTTTDGLENLRHTHPEAYNAFIKEMNKKGSSNPKVVELRTAYRGEISKLVKTTIDKIKRIGGLRVQSFSDFETPHLIDMMQAVMDMSAKNLTSQAYTKVPNFAWVFGGTGIKINLSLIGGVDSNGNLVFDNKEGINAEEAFKIRDYYPEDVGTILVGKNRDSILAAMADDRVDYIIPFHRSGWGKAEFEALGLGDYDDFQAEQNERQLNGVSLPDSEGGNFYPIDYWDYTKSGRENAEIYLQKCAEAKRMPKFNSFLVDNGDGSWSLQPDGSTDGYWKMLIDFKMYNASSTNTYSSGHVIGAPQKEVVPNFNMDQARRVLEEYEGNADGLPTNKKAVDAFVKEYKENHKDTLQFSRELTKGVENRPTVDSEGNNLTEAQMDYFKDSLARDKDGKLKVYYHGTENGGFTIFDPGWSDDGISMFFTDLLYNAKSYSGSPEVYTPKALKTVEDFNEFLNKFDSINIERTYVTEQDGEYAFMYDGDVEFTSDNLDDLWEEISFEMGIGDGPTNYAVYLNAKNPLIVDGHGQQWNDLDPISGEKETAKFTYNKDRTFTVETNGKTLTMNSSEVYRTYGDKVGDAVGNFVPGESADIVLNSATTREYSEYAKENGYDSVIFRNIYDYGGYKRDTDTAEVVVVFNSNQVKSVANTNPTEHRDIRYSRETNRYMELAENPKANERELSKILEDYASSRGYTTGMLYHGTSRFGYTRYNGSLETDSKGMMYATEDRTVAANYAGRDHYANVRSIGKKFIENAITSKDIIANANNYDGSTWKLATKEEKNNILESVRAKAHDIGDLMNKAGDYNVEDTSMANKIAMAVNMFWTMYDVTSEQNIEDVYGSKEDYVHALEEDIEWYDNHYEEVRKYVSEHKEDFSKEWYRLFMGYDLSDTAIDIKYQYMKALSDDDIAINVDTGSLGTIQQLKDMTEDLHNIGSYRLFGKPGDNPLVVDAGGRNWTNVVTDIMGDNGDYGHTTDAIAKKARELGYTSVYFKNVYDGGNKSNEWVFFNPNEQVKSADTVTYDDDGNVIPLTKRFDSKNNDLRFSRKLSNKFTKDFKQKNASVLADDFFNLNPDEVEDIYHEIFKGKADIGLKGEFGRIPTKKANYLFKVLRNSDILVYNFLTHDEYNDIIKKGQKVYGRGYDNSSLYQTERSRGGQNGREPYSPYGKPKSIHLDSVDGETQESNGGGYNAPSLFDEKQLNDFSREISTRTSELAETNKKLKEQLREADRFRGKAEDEIKYLRKQFTLTEVKEADTRSVNRLTKQYLEEYGAGRNADKEVIRNGLKTIGEMWLNADTVDDALTDRIYDESLKVAHEIVTNAEILNDTEAERYKKIKDYLKNTPVAVSPATQRDMTDFGDFKKRNRGIKISSAASVNVTELYNDLREIAPDLFIDEPNESDMLYQIESVLQEEDSIYSPAYGSLDIAMATDEIAMRILGDAISNKIESVASTFADRKQAMIDLRDQKLVDQAKHYQERIKDIYQGKNEALDKQKTRYQEMLDKEVSFRKEKVQKLKEHYAEVRENARNRKLDSQSRQRLLKIVKRLRNKKMTTPNRELVNQFISDLDSVSVSLTQRSVQNLSEIRDWYEDQKENNPDFIPNQAIEDKIRRLSRKHISDLTLEEVASLTEVLLNIENRINYERHLINDVKRRDTYLMAEETVDDINNFKPLGSTKAFEKMDELFVEGTLSPVRFMHRLTGYVEDDPLYELTKGLADGQRKQLKFEMDANKSFAEWVDNKKFMGRISGPGAKAIEISGTGKNGNPVKATISPDMRMYLYLALRNEDNLNHIAGGGITCPNWSEYKKGDMGKAFDKGTTIVKLTPSQIREICKDMPDDEKAFAEKAALFFDRTSRNAINETSEALEGFSLAAVDNYLPITTNPDFTKAEFEGLKKDGTVEGMGFLQERVNASNPIMVPGLSYTLAKSIKGTAKYYGMAIPVRNFNKVYRTNTTYWSTNEAGESVATHFNDSIPYAIKQTWGSRAQKYIEDMMTDVQTGRPGSQDAWGKILGTARGNYAGSTLSMNWSVAFKQAASYPTAGAVVGMGPLLYALRPDNLAKKVDVDLIAKYTPMLWVRDKNTELSTAQNQLKQNFVQKALNSKALNWITDMDILTVKRLWVASEGYVKMHNKALNPGTDAFYVEVAKVFNRVVEETQPNYTAMQRPALLRTDNPVVQTLMMFKTQPFQNFNILYDSMSNLSAKMTQYKANRNEDTKKRLKEAQIGAVNAVTSQLMQLAVFAAMTFLNGFIRGKHDKWDDEEGDITFQSIAKGIGKDMIGGAASMVPFGSDIYDYISSKVFDEKYYGFESVTDSVIKDVVSGFDNAYTELTEMLEDIKNGNFDFNKHRFALDKIASPMSKAFGIPYDNVKNLINALFLNTVKVGAKAGGIDKYEGQLAYLYFSQNPSKKPGEFYDLLKEAYDDNPQDYKKVYDSLIEHGFDPDKIKSNVESRMKVEAGVSSVKDLDERFATPEEKEHIDAEKSAYDLAIDTLTGSKYYNNLDDTAKDKVENSISKMYKGDWDSLDKVRTYEKEAGIDETMYVLYNAALYASDSDGNGSFKKEEKVDALTKLVNDGTFTKKQAAYMFDQLYKKDNPFK